MSDHEIVYISEVRVKREEDRAILIIVEEDVEVWIPKSQIHADSEVEGEGDEGTLAIPRWLAENEDLV